MGGFLPVFVTFFIAPLIDKLNYGWLHFLWALCNNEFSTLYLPDCITFITLFLPDCIITRLQMQDACTHTPTNPHTHARADRWLLELLSQLRIYFLMQHKHKQRSTCPNLQEHVCEIYYQIQRKMYDSLPLLLNSVQ